MTPVRSVECLSLIYNLLICLQARHTGRMKAFRILSTEGYGSHPMNALITIELLGR